MHVRKNIPLIMLVLAITAIPLTVSDPYYLTMLIFIGIYAIATMGLNLLMGYAGQISLGHAAFFALGAYIPAILTTRYEVPCIVAAALAMTLAAAVAYVVGLPCLRLKGHYLAMGTLAFGEIIHIVLNAEVELTGGPSGIAGIPMLGIGGLNADSDIKYFLVVWILFVLLFVLSRNIINSRPGRALQALHGSEQAASAMGIDVAGMKLMVFVLSAAYAALAGVLYVHFVAFISPGAGDIVFSIRMVTMVVVGGMGHLWGGLLGAALLTVLPEMLSYFEDYDMLIYGGILLIMVMFLPGGLTQGFERLRDALRKEGLGMTMENTIVHIRDISKNFGGLAALQKVSITVVRGSITAVIGPNGAGKTTLINVLSGFLLPDNGSISLNNMLINGKKGHVITRLGMARTFQTAQVFGTMSVLENVMVGRYSRTRAGLAGAALRLPGVLAEERATRTRALELLDLVGLTDQASLPAASIPIGSQRLLEIARALASDPQVLLLDEPAAGLNTQETRLLGELLLAIKKQGITIILVEHDMELVMDISDDIAVLNFGQNIARGTPAEIQTNPDVIAVYLGED